MLHLPQPFAVVQNGYPVLPSGAAVVALEQGLVHGWPVSFPETAKSEEKNIYIQSQVQSQRKAAYKYIKE